MSGLFMFLLFLLNILTIFAIIVLFMRQNRFIQVGKDQKAIVKEMEDLMSGYILELKEENEALLEKVVHKKQTSVKKDEENKASIPKETAVLNEINKVEENNVTTTLFSTKNKAAEAYKSQSQIKQEIAPMTGDSLELSTESEKKATKPDNSSFYETLQASLNGYSSEEPSIHEQVNALIKQGLSAEEIAKTLKRGKTEIDLLLRFQNEK